MTNKKDLIVVSAYCPTLSKEGKLQNLIGEIQGLRDIFDILVVSHTPISKDICKKIDHFYYDSNNDLLKDFDLRYMSWFETDDFYIETSLVNNTSTSLAIARQIRYAINFADFWGYQKVHYMEYDFIYKGNDAILDINEKLEEYDTVMFNHPLNTGLFASSVYFAFKTRCLEEESRRFNLVEFLALVRDHRIDVEINGRNQRMTNHGRMTENLNVLLFSKRERKCLFLPSPKNDQTEDSHSNQELKWAFPIYNSEDSSLLFFAHNAFDYTQFLEVFVNGENVINLECFPGNWVLDNLCDFEGDKNIEVRINGEVQKKIEINDRNRDSFASNNYIRKK